MKYGCVLLLVLAIAIPTAAFAHGVVGDYVFLEPLIAEDPTPANEFDIAQPSWTKASDGHDFTLGYSLEKVLYLDDNEMPRFSVGLDNAWHYQWPKNTPDERGYESGATLPVGEGDGRFAQCNGTQVSETVRTSGRLRLFAGTGRSYKPSDVRRRGGRIFTALPEQFRPRHRAEQPFRNLFLFTEFNYSQLITGPSQQTFPNIVATPGIAYVGYHFELSFGTQLALNHASVPGTHAVAIGLLDIFYDSIFPRIGN